jgi:hypothetical protein
LVEAVNGCHFLRFYLFSTPLAFLPWNGQNENKLALKIRFLYR